MLGKDPQKSIYDCHCRPEPTMTWGPMGGGGGSAAALVVWANLKLFGHPPWGGWLDKDFCCPTHLAPPNAPACLHAVRGAHDARSLQYWTVLVCERPSVFSLARTSSALGCGVGLGSCSPVHQPGPGPVQCAGCSCKWLAGPHGTASCRIMMFDTRPPVSAQSKHIMYIRT